MIQNEQVIHFENQEVNESVSKAESILAEVLQKYGWIPKPLQLMAKRSGVLEAFVAYRNQVFEGGPLSGKEEALVALSAAVALKSVQCIPMHANRARKAGAGEDEVIQTMLIANVISGTSPLHIAYAGITEQ